MIYVQLNVNERRAQVTMFQLANIDHRLIKKDDIGHWVQARQRQWAKRSRSVYDCMQTDGYNFGTMPNLIRALRMEYSLHEN